MFIMSEVYASKVIEVADNEVGYLEKKTNSNLDSKTANAGSNNYTKYGRDLVKWIGSPYANGVAWCDMFVDWCFYTAFGKKKAMELLNGWSAYTPTSAQYFKNMGRWHTSKPKAGDVIFFKNSQRICHTGIVYKVDATTVYTIEGNTASKGSDNVIANGGGVFKKSYKLTNSSIAGYGRPAYDQEWEVVIPDKSVKYSYGIDISSNQGDIDFSLVKESGVEFAVLRSTTKNGQADTKFEKYYKGCLTYGIIPFVYKYSYAKTEKEAIEEAKGVIKLLGNRKLIIWYDLENANQVQAIGKSGIEKVAKAFLDTCEKAGFVVGIYCNLNWFNNYIASSLKKKYTFWIARYGKNTGKIDEKYKPNVGETYWQYTSVGSVEGIVGNVDLDVRYK